MALYESLRGGFWGRICSYVLGKRIRYSSCVDGKMTWPHGMRTRAGCPMAVVLHAAQDDQMSDVHVRGCGWILQSRQGHRNIQNSGMYSSAIWGCHEEGSGGGITFWDFVKLSGHTKLIPWPNIQPAAVERAKPQQVRRSCARRGGSGWCCATLSSVRTGSREVLFIQGQAWLMVFFCGDCDLAAEDMEVIACKE
eukprot:365321-Chlamydomonas_euryale.AAC.19